MWDLRNEFDHIELNKERLVLQKNGEIVDDVISNSKIKKTRENPLHLRLITFSNLSAKASFKKTIAIDLKIIEVCVRISFENDKMS